MDIFCRRIILTALVAMMLVPCLYPICGPVGADGPSMSRDEPDLVAYWPFDEASGAIAHDASGHNHNGTIVNGSQRVPGMSGSAFHFDGLNQYVEIPDSTEMNPHTSNWTIAAWVNISRLVPYIYAISGNYGYIIMNKRQNSTSNSLTLLVHGGTSPTSNASFAFIWDGAYQATGAECPKMNITGWHYVVGVRAGGELYVYVDGVRYGPNNFYYLGYEITEATDFNNSDPIHIAHGSQFFNKSYNGSIDELKIWRRALDPSEVLTNYIRIKNPLPDLWVSSADISFSDQNPAVGEKVTVAATVHNIGWANASLVKVRFLDGTQQIDQDQTIASIPMGSMKNVQVDWIATSGSHYIKVVVDPNVVINEYNKTNNAASKDISVKSYLADLSIGQSDITFSNPNPYDHDIVTITVTVHNIGPLNASNVTVRFLDGTKVIGTDQTISGITQKGGTAQAHIAWKATKGKHTINITVDPDSAIPEDDNNNNNASKDISVADTSGTSEAFPWWIILVVILIVVVLVIIFENTRNKKNID
jgi:hypothetical protein